MHIVVSQFVCGENKKDDKSEACLNLEFDWRKNKKLEWKGREGLDCPNKLVWRTN